jgi:cell division septation protein DedD
MKKILFILGTLEIFLSVLCGPLLADTIQFDDFPCVQLPMCEQRNVGQTTSDLSDELTLASFSFSEFISGNSPDSSLAEILPFIYRVLKRLSPIFNDFVEIDGLCVPAYHKLNAFAAEERKDISDTEKKEPQQPVKAPGKVKAQVSTKAPAPERSHAIQLGAFAEKENKKPPTPIKAAERGNGLASAKATPSKGGFAIQLGTFAKKENAERFQKALHKRYAKVNTFIFEDRTTPYYRVRLGYFQTREDAHRYLEIVKKDNLSGVIVQKN